MSWLAAWGSNRMSIKQNLSTWVYKCNYCIVNFRSCLPSCNAYTTPESLTNYMPTSYWKSFDHWHIASNVYKLAGTSILKTIGLCMIIDVIKVQMNNLLGFVSASILPEKATWTISGLNHWWIVSYRRSCRQLRGYYHKFVCENENGYC